MTDAGAKAAKEDPHPTPRRPPSREEEAAAALPHTAISPSTARAVVIVFLLLIGLVPLAQIALESRTGRPTVAEFATLLPTAQKVNDLRRIRGPRSVVKYGFGLLPESAQFNEIKDKLEKNSPLTTYCLPPAQYLKTALLRGGNNQVRIGNGDWLFYQDDISQLTARATQHRGEEVARRIVDFKQQFERAGIRFVMVFIPAKPDVYPEQLSPRLAAADAPLKNRTYDRCLELLRENGVAYVDGVAVAGDLRRREQEDLFLHMDTHCKPRLLEVLAEEIAAVVRREGNLPPAPPMGYYTRDVRAVMPGDLVRILKLPEGQRLYPGDPVTCRSVRYPDGRQWESDPLADVLFVGDSFTDIYLEHRAGLQPHLSFALQRPVDRLPKSGIGVQKLKDALHAEMPRVTGRFAAKRVVIWEMVVRNFYDADWSPLDLELGRLKGDAPAATARPTL